MSYAYSYSSSSSGDFDPFAPLPAAPALYYRSIPAPFDVNDLEALKNMRISSGFYVEKIPKWGQDILRDRRRIFFIYLSDPNAASAPYAYLAPGYPQTQAPPVPIGMVALSLYNEDDPSLASFTLTGRVEITSLFVYQAYRHLGVGASAFMEMERKAREIGASAITMNTLATKQNLHRYSKLGYREFKPRSNQAYSQQDVLGTGVPASDAFACFMEKPLR